MGKGAVLVQEAGHFTALLSGKRWSGEPGGPIGVPYSFDAPAVSNLCLSALHVAAA